MRTLLTCAVAVELFVEFTPPYNEEVQTNTGKAFTPPYNEEVQTNTGKAFFNLINKYLQVHHKLHKTCKKFKAKLSCSCMPNTTSIINNHNSNFCTPKQTIKIYYAIAETLPTAHLMESPLLLKSPKSTKPSRVHRLQSINQCPQLIMI